MTVEGHKKELEFEQEAVRDLECREKQAHARRAQLEREVASLRQKASQDLSGRGEIWSKLMKQREEHEAALGEKEVRFPSSLLLLLSSFRIRLVQDPPDPLKLPWKHCQRQGHLPVM